MHNTKSDIAKHIEDVPIVAAIKSDEQLEKVVDCECPLVFILYGDVCNIPRIVDTIKKSGKMAIVHIDLIEGLSNKEVSVKFIKDNTTADGIISTKPQMIKAAKDFGMIAVQRFFILDSLSMEGVMKQVYSVIADAIEILPAVNPKIVKQFTKKYRIPVIVGGLISDKEDVIQMLGAGATSVSTTKAELWDI